MKRKRFALVLSLLPALLTGVVSAQQEPPGETHLEQRLDQVLAALNSMQHQLDDSKQQIDQLRTELEEVHAQLAATNGGTSQAAAEAASQLQSSVQQLQNQDEVLQAEVKQHDQTKVESASKYPVKITGLLLFSSFSNDGAVDNIDLPILALPRNATIPHGSLAATLRQSIFGLEAKGPVLWGARSSADVHVDFFGGVPYADYTTTSGTLRMRTAHARLDWSHHSLIASLDAPLISPVEPTSYVAAVFWTFLWGLPGLLLSTPLTVCLIVIGRQIPRLHYLEVLLGERTGLPPSEHFYQRMLASNPRDARALIDATLKTRSRAEVYDTVLVPALTMIEEARHSEEMTAARAEEVLQSVEELVEELTSDEAGSPQEPEPARRVWCIPARDFADEIACQLAQQVLEDTIAVKIVPSDSSMTNLQEHMARSTPEVICVVGIPPRAVRHIRMRCHQIRARFPESVVVACVLSDENDLSSLRSRIPTEDAQHVVPSLHLMKAYLTSVLQPAEGVEPAQETAEAAETAEELKADVQEVQRVDPLDGPVEGMFNRLATHLARSLDAPIALITAADGESHFWEAQCGLPEDPTGGAGCSSCVCNAVVSADEIVIINDIEEEERFAGDPFLKAHGIRFCAAAPLKDQDDEVVGSVCVLDTRPRQITEKQRETLVSVAESVTMAIGLREPVRTSELATPS